MAFGLARPVRSAFVDRGVSGLLSTSSCCDFITTAAAEQ